MSTPETPKKVPQFSALKLSPVPAKDDCCCDGACETQNTPPLPESANRYSWVVNGMDCAACARKVENAVKQVPGVSHVRVGKTIEFDLDGADAATAESQAKAMADKLLANTVIESYRVEVG